MPYRRSVLLINPKFQLRYSLYVCSWLVGLSLIYPLIIYSLFELFIGRIGTGVKIPVERMDAMKHEILILLVILQALFLCVTFLISLFVSHRIAGPIHKVKMFLKEVHEGRIRADMRLRKGDHFQDVAEHFNSAMATVLRQKEEDSADASAALFKLEKVLSSSTPETRPDLEDAIEIVQKINARNKA